MDDPVSFDLAFESLLKAAGPLPAGAREALRALGVDPDAPLRPAYPMGTWLRALPVVSAAARPGLPPERALRELGRAFFEAYAASPLGAAAIALGQVIGPRRTLGRMTRNMRATNNYAFAEVRDLGPGEVELLNGILPQYVPPPSARLPYPIPDYNLGLFGAVVERLGVRNGRVELASRDDARFQCSFHIRWDA